MGTVFSRTPALRTAAKRFYTITAQGGYLLPLNEIKEVIKMTELNVTAIKYFENKVILLGEFKSIKFFFDLLVIFSSCFIRFLIIDDFHFTQIFFGIL